MTTKEYMQCVTAVEGQWLAEMGPMFFSVKESHLSHVKKRQNEKQNLSLMESEFGEAIKEDETKLKNLSQIRPATKERIATLGTPRRTPSRIKGF